MNRRGRQTSDPKETTVKLRLNEDMRKHIEQSSKRKAVTMSEYIRQLIKNDMRDK